MKAKFSYRFIGKCLEKSNTLGEKTWRKYASAADELFSKCPKTWEKLIAINNKEETKYISQQLLTNTVSYYAFFCYFIYYTSNVCRFLLKEI